MSICGGGGDIHWSDKLQNVAAISHLCRFIELIKSLRSLTGGKNNFRFSFINISKLI